MSTVGIYGLPARRKQGTPQEGSSEEPFAVELSVTVSGTGSFPASCPMSSWQLSRGLFGPVPHSEQGLLQKINLTIFIVTHGVYSHFTLTEPVSMSPGEQKTCFMFSSQLITLFCQACTGSELNPFAA